MHSTSYLALLRGVNVTGYNRIPMAELRVLCAELGWSDVKTYIQSGNLIFQASGAPEALEDTLERTIRRRFALSIPVIVRSAARWSAYVTSNPYPKASETEPQLVMMALSKASPRPTALDELRKRAAGGERIEQTGEVLWIHFPSGVARSKLSPALLDRLAGSPVTMRNWRTVCKLEELASTAGTGEAPASS